MNPETTLKYVRSWSRSVETVVIDITLAWDCACDENAFQADRESLLGLRRIIERLELDKQPEAQVQPSYEAIMTAVTTTASKIRQLCTIRQRYIEQLHPTPDGYKAPRRSCLELGDALKDLLYKWLKQKKQYANKGAPKNSILSTQAQYGVFQETLVKCRRAYREFNQQCSLEISSSQQAISADLILVSSDQVSPLTTTLGEGDVGSCMEDEKRSRKYERGRAKRGIPTDQINTKRRKVSLSPHSSSTGVGHVHRSADAAGTMTDGVCDDNWRPGLGVDEWCLRRQIREAAPEHIVIED